jgi:hypothetical protein
MDHIEDCKAPETPEMRLHIRSRSPIRGTSVGEVDVVLAEFGLELSSGQVSLASQRFGSASVPVLWGAAASKNSALVHCRFE